MYGTVVNVGSVIVGSGLGLVIHSRLPGKVTSIVFQGIGLFTILLGVSMAVRTTNFLIMIFSIVLGSIAGELIDIERHFTRLSESLKSAVGSKNERFSEGLITSFMLFCMGSMTVLGAIEEGLGGEPNLLLAKSVLDGFSSIALSSAMGLGVMFSAIPLLVYQGSLTLLAGLLQGFFTESIINELTSTGGLLIIGLGINILEIKKLRILNMLPAIGVAAVLSWIFI